MFYSIAGSLLYTRIEIPTFRALLGSNKLALSERKLDLLSLTEHICLINQLHWNDVDRDFESELDWLYERLHNRGGSHLRSISEIWLNTGGAPKYTTNRLLKSIIQRAQLETSCSAELHISNDRRRESTDMSPPNSDLLARACVTSEPITSMQILTIGYSTA